MMFKKIVIFLFCALSCGNIHAEVFENIDYLYYEASTHKGEKQTLVEHLNAASPLRINNNIQHSFTRWNIEWTIKTVNSAESMCTVSDVKVSVNALIQLPELVGEENASLQKEFNAYTAKLQSHEIGHYMLFAIQAANEIDVRLTNMEPLGSCKILETQANEKAKNILSHYKNKEKEFDATTNFGRK